MAKKIKKTEKVLSCKDADVLKAFVKQENKKTKRTYKPRKPKPPRKPSEIPSLVYWKEKEVKDWCATDFLGYYFYKYKKIIKEDDVEFMGISRTYSFGKERGFIKKCLNDFFNSDKKEFKKFIDFILPWWISKESWTKDLPVLNSVFLNANFVKAYKSSKCKKRNILDNNYADKENWDTHFEEKGE